MNRDAELAFNLSRRVGDRERDECVETLNAQHALGRLRVEELDRRQDLALSAVTFYDLLALVADFPDPSRPASADVAATSPTALRWEDRWERVSARAGAHGIAIASVLGAAWFSDYLWGYDDPAVILGTCVGGVVGYGARALTAVRRKASKSAHRD